MSGSDRYPLLLDKIISHAVEFPEKAALHWVDDDAEVIAQVTYDQIIKKSQALAFLLLKNGIIPGDRVILAFPSCQEFIISFLACLFAGIIAVPVAPPDPSKLHNDLQMFSTIVSSCGAKVTLTCKSYSFATKLASIKDIFSSQGQAQWPELRWIVVDPLINEHYTPTQLEVLPVKTYDTVAFLQYTSGSTSEPKGVMITHGNLAHNIALISKGLKLGHDTVGISWLPHFHDMGLIGSYLGAMYSGGKGYYFSPLSFVRNPCLWIQVISKYRGTHMQAPNFAYTLTARKFLSFEESVQNGAYGKNSWVNDLDLSCVKHMINASEPVESAAIDLFNAVFTKYKLPLGTIFPTYGLAEHTVYVCSNGVGRLVINKDELELNQKIVMYQSRDQGTKKKSKKVALSGCGKPSESEGVDLKIVNSESGQSLPEDFVGEIWIKSKSCAAGYWDLPDKTQEDFDGVICSDVTDSDLLAADGGYLRTGDLGFLHDGELYICGRQKDLIIIRGRNHYPQDIERSCESRFPESLRGGCSAAFSTNEEVLVYVAEVTEGYTTKPSQDHSQLTKAMRQAIFQDHGVSPAAILLLLPKTIFKTKSGKIARSMVRKGYETDNLKVLFSWSETEAESVQTGEETLPDLDIYLPSEPFDPTGMSVSTLLPYVKFAVVNVMKSSNKDVSTLKSNSTLLSCGLDSMSAIELNGIIEKIFTVPLPEKLLTIPDATLTTIAKALSQGGDITDRPVMYNGWEILEEAAKREKATKGKAKGVLPSDWLRSHATLADIDTFQFKPGVGLNELKLTSFEEARYIFDYIVFLSQVALSPYFFLGLFLFLSFKTALLVNAVLLSIVYFYPSEAWPPAFRTSESSILSLKYYTYRVIVEAKINPNIPTIYAFGPHGVFALPSYFQLLFHEFIVGHNYHLLAADVVFKMPLYNMICKSAGMKSISRPSFLSILRKGRSVGFIPGGIAEMFGAGHPTEEQAMLLNRKGFIKIALETGAQIVPAYTYGHSQVLKTKESKTLKRISRIIRVSLIPAIVGRWGTPIPFRGPTVTVLGRPILVPKVEKPSDELVDEYHALYLSEIKRVYNAYKHVYNWHDPDRPLVLKG